MTPERVDYFSDDDYEFAVQDELEKETEMTAPDFDAMELDAARAFAKDGYNQAEAAEHKLAAALVAVRGQRLRDVRIVSASSVQYVEGWNGAIDAAVKAIGKAGAK